MSKLIAAYSSAGAKTGEDGPLVLALREEFPELVKALQGCKNLDGQCVMPPCTLMIFLEGDRLGFCISPKTGTKVAFGTVPDPSKGLAGIEHELAEGHFEWKQKRGR